MIKIGRNKRLLSLIMTLMLVLGSTLFSHSFASTFSITVGSFEEYVSSVYEASKSTPDTIEVTFDPRVGFSSKEEIQTYVMSTRDSFPNDWVKWNSSTRGGGFNYSFTPDLDDEYKFIVKDGYGLTGVTISEDGLHAYDPEGVEIPAEEIFKGTFTLKNAVLNTTYKNTLEDINYARGVIGSKVNEFYTLYPYGTEVEALHYIYDFIGDTLVYGEIDRTGMTAEEIEFARVAERNVVNALNGQGVVCEAFAYLLMYGADYIDLNNNLVISDGHMWNAINYKGNWYYVDPTWGEQESQRQNYFMLSYSDLESRSNGTDHIINEGAVNTSTSYDYSLATEYKTIGAIYEYPELIEEGQPTITLEGTDATVTLVTSNPSDITYAVRNVTMGETESNLRSLLLSTDKYTQPGFGEYSFIVNGLEPGNSYEIDVLAQYMGNHYELATLSVEVPIIEELAIALSHYTTEPTNQDITVTASTNRGVLNQESYTFTENGTFEFIAVDGLEEVSETVTITNIDKVPPVITIDAFSTDETENPVTVYASTNEGTLNQESYTFTTNGSFVFIATDNAGNVTSELVTLTNIVEPSTPVTDPVNLSDYVIQNNGFDNTSGFSVDFRELESTYGVSKFAYVYSEGYDESILNTFDSYHLISGAVKNTGDYINTDTIKGITTTDNYVNLFFYDDSNAFIGYAIKFINQGKADSLVMGKLLDGAPTIESIDEHTVKVTFNFVDNNGLSIPVFELRSIESSPLNIQSLLDSCLFTPDVMIKGEYSTIVDTRTFGGNDFALDFLFLKDNIYEYYSVDFEAYKEPTPGEIDLLLDIFTLVDIDGELNVRATLGDLVSIHDIKKFSGKHFPEILDHYALQAYLATEYKSPSTAVNITSSTFNLQVIEDLPYNILTLYDSYDNLVAYATYFYEYGSESDVVDVNPLLLEEIGQLVDTDSGIVVKFSPNEVKGIMSEISKFNNFSFSKEIETYELNLINNRISEGKVTPIELLSVDSLDFNTSEESGYHVTAFFNSNNEFIAYFVVDLASTPIVLEPAPTDPTPTEPAPTEPVPTEPAPTEPVPTEPAPTEPAPTEPAPTEPAPTEPAPTEPAPTEPAPTPGPVAPPAPPAPPAPAPAPPAPPAATQPPALPPIQEPREANVVAIEDMTPEKITNAIQEAMKKLTGQKDIILEIAGSAQEIELPSASLGTLSKANKDLTIEKEGVKYSIPSSQLNPESMVSLLGESTKMENISLAVRVTKVNPVQTFMISENAKKIGMELIGNPIQFEVEIRDKEDQSNKTVKITEFNKYVNRDIEISKEDYSRNLQGVYVDTSGNLQPIPTTLFEDNGKYYATLSSLTNSTYALVSVSKTVPSVASHWSHKAVNEMASRLVLTDIDAFNPDQTITRAEFANYIVRALGLYKDHQYSEDKFKDITKDSEHANAIILANKWGIVNGYDDGTFRPDNTITREEAMQMYSNALTYMTLQAKHSNRLNAFDDKNLVSGWATPAVSKILNTGVFNGKSKTILDPKGTLTHAESLQALLNLLTESKLINQ